MNQYHPHAAEGYFCGTPPAGATLMKASFFFCGDGLDFDTFQRRLGCEPAYFRKKEDWPAVSQKMGVAQDEWVVSTCFCESRSAPEVIGALLDRLEGKEAEILALKEEFGAVTRMVLAVHTHHTPDLSVPLRCIGFLSATGTELDFDPYFYSE